MSMMYSGHMCSYAALFQGLTILANTCNLDTAGWYSRFTDHVACAGLQNEETVAVINRRYTNPLILIYM